MVKRLLGRLIYEYGSKALNSVFKAYKDTVKNAPKTGGEKKQEDSKQKSAFGKFNFQNLIASPMTKDEAMKILNVKEADATPELIMERFEKYFEANDAMKGGSFYVQNKIYYAKEFLMEKFPKELNKSKFNPSTFGSSSASGEKKEDKEEKGKSGEEEKAKSAEEEAMDKNKNTKI